jgi:branched-chain amino acid transport system substrate-binding protein
MSVGIGGALRQRTDTPPRGSVVAAAVIGGGILLASVGCSRGGSSLGSGADTLYVGVAAARANANYFNGVQLALDRLNSERPSGAPYLALKLPPDQQPSQVRVAEGFRDDPSVIGVVGHTGSAQTMDAAPVYGDVDHGGRRAVVAITPTATNPAVTKGSDWVFRVCPTDDDAARALARFAIDSVRAKRVAILYRNDLFGRGFTRVIVPELQRRGAVVVEKDPYLAGVTAYEAYAERIARESIDALIVAGGGVDAADMIRALRKSGARPAVLGTDDVSNVVADAAGGAKPGEFDGVRFTAFFQPTKASAGAGDAAAFVTEYRRRFGATPSQQAALSYDAEMLIGRAVHAVGRDRVKVRDRIASVGSDAPPHHGLTGDIRFAGQHDAQGKQVLIGQVEP